MIEQWRNGLPFWEDSGARIDILNPDGSIETGTLEQYDQTPGPEEAPLYHLVKDDGSRASGLYTCKGWRYTDDAGSKHG